MRQRKYVGIQVFREIYVSSSMHYFAKARWIDNKTKRGDSRDYCISEQSFIRKDDMGWFDMPRYVYREVAQLLAAMIDEGRAVFYEYDRDGNKRYDNLRYYDAEHVKWLTAQLHKAV